MSMDKKTPYCQDVLFFFFPPGSKDQCDSNKKSRKLFCRCWQTFTELYMEGQNTQNSQENTE